MLSASRLATSVGTISTLGASLEQFSLLRAAEYPFSYPASSLYHSLSASHSRKMSSSAGSSQPKPPNILIYQSDKNTSNTGFLRARESLESCLTPERYVIYPLGADDVLHYSPWKENCRLLVIPPSLAQSVATDTTTLSPRVMEEVLGFVREGGNLLSMQTDLNRLLGLTSVQEALGGVKVDECSQEVLTSAYCPDGACDVEVSAEGVGMEQGYRFSSLVPNLHKEAVNPADDAYLKRLLPKDVIQSRSVEASLVPVEWNEDMEWIKQNTNQCNNKDQSRTDRLPNSAHQRLRNLPAIPCVHKLLLGNSGCTVVSSVDLFPALPSPLEVLPLLRLKKGVALRGRFLASLLKALGLECSEEQLPELTHTYLLCSEEVGGLKLLQGGLNQGSNSLHCSSVLASFPGLPLPLLSLLALTFIPSQLDYEGEEGLGMRLELQTPKFHVDTFWNLDISKET